MRNRKILFSITFACSLIMTSIGSYMCMNSDNYVYAETENQSEDQDTNQTEVVLVPKVYNVSLVQTPQITINKAETVEEENIDIEMEDDIQSRTIVASATKEQNDVSYATETDGSDTESADSHYGEYLGNYLITGYCPCSACCGKSTGITASGTQATEGRTIAAPSNFAFGTKLIIDGQVYTVEDRGGAVNGNHIDMFYNDHYTAYCSTHYSDVYMYVE